jgi:hypothetical protein
VRPSVVAPRLLATLPALVTLATLVTLAAGPSAAGAQAPAPAPTHGTPRTEVGPRGAERRLMVAGTTLTLRPSADGFIDATLTASAARLYEVLPMAFGDVGLVAKEVDQRVQQAGTGPFRAQFRLGKQRLSGLVDCGIDATGLRQADSFSLTMRVTAQVVEESAERATVRTLVQTTGRAPSTSGTDIRCQTTGRLEERLVEAIARRASGDTR